METATETAAAAPPKTPDTDEKVAAAADDPRRIVVRVPLAECSLREAQDLIEDASFYDLTRMPILHEFPQVTVDGYWDLTVRDHAEMVSYLSDKGLL